MSPASTATTADLQAQYDALMQLAQTQERAEADMAQLQSMQRKMKPMRKNPPITSIWQRSSELLAQLRNPEPSGYREPARLTEQLAYLRDTIAQYDGSPTGAQKAAIEQYAKQVDEVDTAVKALAAAVLQTGAR
jgi:hypothetical protein